MVKLGVGVSTKHACHGWGHVSVFSFRAQPRLSAGLMKTFGLRKLGTIQYDDPK